MESLIGSGGDALETVTAAFGTIATDAKTAADEAGRVSGQLTEAAGAADEASNVVRDNLLTGLTGAAEQAKLIGDRLRALNGLTVSVRIVGVPGRATGGPTTAGQTYQVNELGQEGFLSNSGHLAPIQKPRNSLWRAPAAGTVIPAHIWAKMDIPKGGVKVNTGSIPAASTDNRLTNAVRQIQASVSQESSMNEMASIQAQQAIEIGKLGRAVEKLAGKKWDVNVGVNSGSSGGYLGALNRLL